MKWWQEKLQLLHTKGKQSREIRLIKMFCVFFIFQAGVMITCKSTGKDKFKIVFFDQEVFKYIYRKNHIDYSKY